MVLVHELAIGGIDRPGICVQAYLLIFARREYSCEPKRARDEFSWRWRRPLASLGLGSLLVGLSADRARVGAVVVVSSWLAWINLRWRYST